MSSSRSARQRSSSLTRSARGWAGGIALGLGLWFVAPSEAEACSCRRIDDPMEARESVDYVFEGKAVEMRKEKVAPPGVDPKFAMEMHVWTFEVGTTHKGELPKSIDLRTANNSAACGRSFKAGESYLVYARNDTQNEGIRDNLCSRTQLISEAQDDLRAFSGEAPADSETDKAPAQPGPPAGEAPPSEEAPAPDAPEEPASTPEAPPQGSAEPAVPSDRGCQIGGAPAPSGAWLALPLLAWRLRRRMA